MKPGLAERRDRRHWQIEGARGFLSHTGAIHLNQRGYQRAIRPANLLHASLCCLLIGRQVHDGIQVNVAARHAGIFTSRRRRQRHGGEGAICCRVLVWLLRCMSCLGLSSHLPESGKMSVLFFGTIFSPCSSTSSSAALLFLFLGISFSFFLALAHTHFCQFF